tara:strand:- start:749 stop:919 length:171 start_codon:yes stop_codon:yes gene_type:complete
MKMEKTCPICKKQFVITKWQKSKIYCTEFCKPKTKKPSTGRPTGRPRKTYEIQRNI